MEAKTKSSFLAGFSVIGRLYIGVHYLGKNPSSTVNQTMRRKYGLSLLEALRR